MPGLAPDDVSLGEVYRGLIALKEDTDNRLQGIHNHVDRRFDELLHIIERQTFVPKGEYEAKHAALMRRVEAIEQRKSAMVTAIIAGVVSLTVGILILVIQLGVSR